MDKSQRKMMRVLAGETMTVPPVWLMRQAGRYLPEYRETRKQAGGFLDLCYTPELAVEVTLQPIRRFGFDASILFSDILVIPDAIGRKVRFEEGRGPLLEPITLEEASGFVIDAERIGSALAHLAPVIETVSILRKELPGETTFLGFCGAPWTVATYMIAGHGTSDQAPARKFGHSHPEVMDRMLEGLADVSAAYLVAQLNAGADAVQIFDSWSGVLGPHEFERWCVKPVRRIVEAVRNAVPDARIIGFPKGASLELATYRQRVGVDMLGLDWTIPVPFARELQKGGPVQGNLDPVRLVAGGEALRESVSELMEGLCSGPYVFNLGHGITPDTPISHVEEMLRMIRG